MSSVHAGLTAAALLRSVDLLADGPAAWGRPTPARGPGIYVVELPEPPETAPLELTRVGKWLEHVPDLRVNGERPTSRALARVLASAWSVGQPVLYAGSTTSSIGGRIASLRIHVPGERRPHADGHWLHLLRPTSLAAARVWWASTDAPEEYLDALLDAYAEKVPGGTLPWANTRSPSGRRRESGITGALLPAEERAAVPPTRVVALPDADADGARAVTRATGTTRRAPRAPGAAPGSPRREPPRPREERPELAPNALTAEGQLRLQTELDELVKVRRPEVIGRIRAAKELGDLKENADYTAAREEQSFLEGRVQAIESRLRDAVVVEAAAAGGRADLGSVVHVEQDGDEATYTLVGASESDPAAGRISADSPVGRALLGARTGDVVTVRTPRGEVNYRVIEVR